VLVKKRDDGLLYTAKIVHKADIIAENAIESLKIEREVLTLLNHPFIAKLHFVFHNNRRIFMVSDFVSGGSLFDLLKCNYTFIESE